MQTLHGRCGCSPRHRPKALGRFDADREAASRRLAPLSRRGPRRHPRGIGVRSPVSRRSGSAAHGGVQAETLLVGTQRLGECGVWRLGALHREHLGACRAWGASAANRPQRSISHRLFAPWLGYGAANPARTVLAGADSRFSTPQARQAPSRQKGREPERLSFMPAHHAKVPPLVVANARHSPGYGCALRLDRAPFDALFGHARKTLRL